MSYDAVWEWPPDWSGDVIERLRYLTDVQQTRTGAEARRRIRDDPRRSVEFTTIQLASQHPSGVSRYDRLHQMNAAIWGVGIDRWLMPLWWDVADAVWDEPTAGFVGANIGKWRDWSEDSFIVYEHRGDFYSDSVVLVEDDAIYVSGNVDLDDRSEVRVYPARPAAIHVDQAFDRVSSQVFRLEVRADLIDYEAPDPIELQPYEGLDVFLAEYDRSESSSTQSRVAEVVDFNTGRVEYYDDAGRPYIDHDLLYTFRSSEDAWEMRRWLQRLGGRARDFWAPTHDEDLDVIEVSGSMLIVTPIRWEERYEGNLGRQHLYLDTDEGPIIGEVVSAQISGGLEEIEINAPIPVDAGGIHQVSWLERRRLASDSVEMVWVRPHISQIDLPQQMISKTL